MQKCTKKQEEDQYRNEVLHIRPPWMCFSSPTRWTTGKAWIMNFAVLYTSRIYYGTIHSIRHMRYSGQFSNGWHDDFRLPNTQPDWWSWVSIEAWWALSRSSRLPEDNSWCMMCYLRLLPRWCMLKSTKDQRKKMRSADLGFRMMMRSMLQSKKCWWLMLEAEEDCWGLVTHIVEDGKLLTSIVQQPSTKMNPRTTRGGTRHDARRSDNTKLVMVLDAARQVWYYC